MWFVWALISGLTFSVALEANKHFKLEGLTLTFWRSVMSALLMLPLILAMEWPSDPVYYLVICLTSAVSVIGTVVQFNLAAKHNGRVANLDLPVKIVLAFLIWLVIDRVEREAFFSDPVYAGGVLASFALMIASLQFVRKNDASWSAFLAILPIGVLYAVIGVLTKLMLDDGESVLGISLSWVFLGSILMAVTSLPLLVSQKMSGKKLDIVSPNILKGALFCAFFATIAGVTYNFAVIATPNPGYPGVVIAMTPVWFAVYYKCMGIKDELSPVAGLFLGLSALILLLVTL